MVRLFQHGWCKTHKPRADQKFSPTQPTRHKIVRRLLTNWPIMVGHSEIVKERVWFILFSQQKSTVRRFSRWWWKFHLPRADQNFSSPQPIHHKSFRTFLILHPIMVGHRVILGKWFGAFYSHSWNPYYGDFHLGSENLIITYAGTDPKIVQKFLINCPIMVGYREIVR